MIQLFRIYCGLDTDGRLTTDEARKIAETQAYGAFPGGHTIIDAQGHWRSAANLPITEPTVIIEVLTDDENTVRKLAGNYKALAFQESVLITKTEVDASFV